jgi:AcrR family transcriptional regulator
MMTAVSHSSRVSPINGPVQNVSPRADSRDQKERIRRKAAELFARNGYHGTGVQALSEAVGLGRGALYHHIGSKEALVEEIVTPQIHAMIEFGEHLLAEDLPAAEKARRLSRALMRTLADQLAEWTVFQRDAATLRGPVRQRIFAARDRFEDVWASIVEQGVAAGEFRVLDPIAIKGMLGMHNYGYLWIRKRGRLTPEEIADVFCDMLLRGILRGE